MPRRLPGASTTLRMRELLATVPRTWPTVTWDVSPDSPLMRKVSLRMLGRAGSSALLISPTRAPMSGAAARALAVSDARINEAATITRMENLLRPRQHVVGQGRSRAVGRSRRGADEIPTPRTAGRLAGSPWSAASERDRWRGLRDRTLCARRGHVPRSDPELFHLRHERRALEAETRRGATRTCDDAVRLAEDIEDVLARGVVEGLGRRGGCRGYPHPGVQGRQLQARAAREDHRSVDGVLKLADVTGPRVAHEPLHHIGRNRLDAPAETSGVVRDEVAHEKRDVLGPLAKGREIDRKNVQPVVKVGAKLSRLDQLLERTVRRGDDPDVAPDRVRAPDPLELLLLEHAKELRLEVQRQVTDLVEEQGAVVRELEAADPSRDGTGEGATLVAEELALQEARGDGGAVELDERATAPGAERVDQAADQLLASTRLAPYEHGRVGRRHALDQADDSPERQAPADDSVDGGRVRRTATPLHGPRRIRAAARRGPRIVGRRCLLCDR